MNKMYLILAVVAIIVGGVWFTMKKTPSSIAPPLNTDSSGAQPTVSAEPSITITKSNEITLTIVSPLTNTSVTTSTVTVAGKTVANADVFVNDTETKADSNGFFSAAVPLDEGENSIIIVANDANGNTAEQEIMVTSETY